MEKLFQPGKWFVLFCAIFILVWGARQYIANCRLQSEAQRWAAYVFNWQWAGDCSATASIVETDVLNHNDTDAVVRVKAHQNLQLVGQGLQTADSAAILKLYKRSTTHGVIWELGEVQFL